MVIFEGFYGGKNMCDNKTIEDFQAIGRQEPIISRGEIYNNKCNINASSIWTKLIQEAGRWCRDFASDLLCDYMQIQEKMDAATLETESHLFGFREYGVDHDNFIFSRYSNQTVYGSAALEYRAIWRLDIAVEEVESTSQMRSVTLSLYEVHR